MSKIRINELARELEVKPHAIIEVLPELGISEKKTHSSSLEDDLVLKCAASAWRGSGAEEQRGAVLEAAPRQEPARHSAVALEEEPAAGARSAPAPLRQSRAEARGFRSPLKIPKLRRRCVRRCAGASAVGDGTTGWPDAPANRGPVIPSRLRATAAASGTDSFRTPPADAAHGLGADFCRGHRPSPATSDEPGSAAGRALLLRPPPAQPVMITTPGAPRPGAAVPTIPIASPACNEADSGSRAARPRRTVAAAQRCRRCVRPPSRI